MIGLWDFIGAAAVSLREVSSPWVWVATEATASGIGAASSIPGSIFMATLLSERLLPQLGTVG